MPAELTSRVVSKAAIALFAVAAFLLSGCRERRGEAIRDDLGRDVALGTPIRRIVSLAPNVTETLVLIGAGDRIVGTDDFSNHPPAVRSLPKLGGVSPSIERIAALQPDLVIASTSANHPTLPRVLESIEVPLYVTRVERLADVPAFMRRLGSVVDASEAERHARQFEMEIEKERRSRPHAPRVLLVVWADPLFISGRATFIDDLFELTGARNHVDAAVTGWPQYSYEKLVSDPPDLVLVAGGESVMTVLRSKLDPLTLKKVEYRLVDEDLFSRPGPRLVQAARELNTILDEWEAMR